MRNVAYPCGLSLHTSNRLSSGTGGSFVGGIWNFTQACPFTVFRGRCVCLLFTATLGRALKRDNETSFAFRLLTSSRARTKSADPQRRKGNLQCMARVPDLRAAALGPHERADLCGFAGNMSTWVPRGWLGCSLSASEEGESARGSRRDRRCRHYHYGATFTAAHVFLRCRCLSSFLTRRPVPFDCILPPKLA